MHVEKNSTVPLSAEEPQVGDRIPPPDVDASEDFEVERYIVTLNQGCHYSREELTKLTSKDPCYQKYKTALMETRATPTPTSEQIEVARKKVQEAYLHLRKLETAKEWKREACQTLLNMLMKRAMTLLEKDSMKSIKKIQLVLGTAHLKHVKKVIGLERPNSVPQSLRVKGMLEQLLKPLDAPDETSNTASPATPS